MQTDDSDNGLSLVIRVVLPVMGEEKVNTFTKGNLCPASRQQVEGRELFLHFGFSIAFSSKQFLCYSGVFGGGIF